MEAKEKIKFYLDKFDYYLEKYMPKQESGLKNAMNYTLKAPCKRIRPLIMLAFYELCSGKSEEIYKFACALEMIHTYSLIHDDLPCMDNDEIRRGKKCSHLEFGEATAVLAGDALLTHAFEVASSSEGGISNYENTLKCINILSHYAGACGMVLGQYYDLNEEKVEILKLHELKTANLFIAAAKIAATLASADEEKIKLSEKFAWSVGISFQLVDDIIDGDIKLEDKLPFGSVEDFIFKLIGEAEDILKKFDGDSSILRYLLGLICSKIK